MVYSHTPGTSLAFLQLENAIKGKTKDNLNELVGELKVLYDKAIEVDSMCNDIKSGSYIL